MRTRRRFSAAFKRETVALRRKGPMGPTRDPIATAAGQALEVPTAAVRVSGTAEARRER